MAGLSFAAEMRNLVNRACRVYLCVWAGAFLSANIWFEKERGWNYGSVGTPPKLFQAAPPLMILIWVVPGGRDVEVLRYL